MDPQNCSATEFAVRKCPFLHSVAAREGQKYAESIALDPTLPAGWREQLVPQAMHPEMLLESFQTFHGPATGVVPLVGFEARAAALKERVAGKGCPFHAMMASSPVAAVVPAAAAPAARPFSTPAGLAGRGLPVASIGLSSFGGGLGEFLRRHLQQQQQQKRWRGSGSDPSSTGSGGGPRPPRHIRRAPGTGGIGGGAAGASSSSGRVGPASGGAGSGAGGAGSGASGSLRPERGPAPPSRSPTNNAQPGSGSNGAGSAGGARGPAGPNAAATGAAAGGSASSSASGAAAIGGTCPMRRWLGPAAGLVFDSYGHLHCPEPIVAARAALARTAPVRSLRPQALPLKLLAVAATAAAVNVPCGAWREHFEKFSFGWFVAVHATIPFVAMLRKAVVMPKHAILVTVVAAVVGQMVGSRLERARLAAAKQKGAAARAASAPARRAPPAVSAAAAKAPKRAPAAAAAAHGQELLPPSCALASLTQRPSPAQAVAGALQSLTGRALRDQPVQV